MSGRLSPEGTVGSPDPRRLPDEDRPTDQPRTGIRKVPESCLTPSPALPSHEENLGFRVGGVNWCPRGPSIPTILTQTLFGSRLIPRVWVGW